MRDFVDRIADKGWKLYKDPPADGNCCSGHINNQLSTLQSPVFISKRFKGQGSPLTMDNGLEESLKRLEILSYLSVFSIKLRLCISL